MILRLADRRAVALSAATWFAVSVSIGAVANRWPPERLTATGPVTTLRPWEDSGAFWQRHLRVARWKDLVPEAGDAFAGGYAKRRIRSRSTDGLAHFRRETIRAERVHWAIFATTPVHAIWCRPPVFFGMVIFGVAFNAPFVIIQRYNRGRLDRLIARRTPDRRTR